MPELRKDPILGRWVIIATERGRRPSDFKESVEQMKHGFCPFCYGNEHLTPPEILTVREKGTEKNKPGWKVRVVPNKFPALQIEGELNREPVGIFDKMNGIGAHEVIIETPNHEQFLADLDEEHFKYVLWAYKERMIDLRKDPRFEYILIFKNHGQAAGASLEHTHTQLIATPIIPVRVMEELHGTQDYHERKERCIFCDIIKQEVKDNVRVVCINDAFVSLEPYASRFPFETHIFPREHSSDFVNNQFDKNLPYLVKIMKETLMRISKALSNPPYNFIIHTAPCKKNNLDYYHWHIEIMPKLTKVAGFEWGSGFYINPTPPEDATKYLREVEI